jgi:pentatricopeptide repeat protein
MKKQGERLVGCRVEVQWPYSDGSSKCLLGVIAEARPAKAKKGSSFRYRLQLDNQTQFQDGEGIQEVWTRLAHLTHKILDEPSSASKNTKAEKKAEKKALEEKEKSERKADKLRLKEEKAAKKAAKLEKSAKKEKDKKDKTKRKRSDSDDSIIVAKSKKKSKRGEVGEEPASKAEPKRQRVEDVDSRGKKKDMKTPTTLSTLVAPVATVDLNQNSGPIDPALLAESKQSLFDRLSRPKAKWQEVVGVIEALEQGDSFLGGRDFTKMISTCAKVGLFNKAEALLDVMATRSIPPAGFHYSAAINALSRGKQWERAVALLDRMANEGVSPNLFCMNAAISACEKGMQWEKAVELLESIPSRKSEGGKGGKGKGKGKGKGGKGGGKGGQGQGDDGRLWPDAISFNSAISACARWVHFPSHMLSALSPDPFLFSFLGAAVSSGSVQWPSSNRWRPNSASSPRRSRTVQR